jgi:hypothetical protein
MNTYSSYIWMVDPRLEDEWTNTIYNDNCIIVLFCYGKDKCVFSMPCRQVVSAKTESQVSVHIADPKVRQKEHTDRLDYHRR